MRHWLSGVARFTGLEWQLARAGTRALRSRIESQIKVLLEKQFHLKSRLDVKAELTIQDQVTFYSSWIYGAIHVMLTVEQFQTSEAISKRVGLSLKKTNEILEFLVSIGLAKPLRTGSYDVGTARIHLGVDSPMISKFHTNWRMKAIQSLEKENLADELHYSSAITISRDDFLRIKSLLIAQIEEIKAIIRESPAEDAYCFSMDLFGI